MEYECRITRSCIYWDPEERDIMDFIIVADSELEARAKLRQKAIRVDIRSGSKLVQDIMIRRDGEWVPVSVRG